MSLGPWDNNVAACLVGSGGGKKFSSHLALSTNNNRQSPQKEQKMINCTFNARLLLQTMFLSRQRNLCSLWTSTSISYSKPSQGKTPLLPYIIYHAVNRGVSPMWKQLKHFPDVCAELCWGEVRSTWRGGDEEVPDDGVVWGYSYRYGFNIIMITCSSLIYSYLYSYTHGRNSNLLLILVGGSNSVASRGRRSIKRGTCSWELKHTHVKY